MAEVLISWIIIGITSYTVGFEICGFHDRLVSVPHPHVLRCLVGLCAVNVYAEVFSLFTGVGMWADYLLMLICLVIVYFDRSRLGQAMDISAAAKRSPVKALIYVLIILTMAYGTSRGYMHFDTNLYHAQAIHWIEDYGTVPGLANIQSRFGYNSAEFALNALYGFKWYLGRSLHTSAGFFAMLSSFIAMDIYRAFGKSETGRPVIRPRVSDFVRIGLIFYLGVIYSEMISPSSDHYAQLLLFDIIIIWLDAVHLTEAYSVYAVLCLLMVYAVTVKLSLAPLLLLALIPGIYWIKNKKYGNIAICLITGLLVMVPYFIRGYIISGWILYPSTLIKLGSPDWQVPKGMAQYDAREIGMWGRGITRAEDWDTVNAFNWLPAYVSALSPMEKLWLIMSAVALVIIVILCVRAFILRRVMKHKSDSLLPVPMILCIGMVTWFVAAPLIRYGYSYIIIVPLITVGMYCGYPYDLHNISILNLPKGINSNMRYRINTTVFLILFAAVAVLKIKGLLVDITQTMNEKQYYVNQQDYIDGEAFTYTVDGVTVYVAEDSGQIGYYKLPSTVEERHDFALRGSDLSDGFYHTN